MNESTPPRTHNPSVTGSSPVRPTTSHLRKLRIPRLAATGADTQSDTRSALRATVRGIKLGITLLAATLLVGGMTVRAFAGPLYASLPVESGTETFVIDSDRPVAEGSPQALIEAHDCWTGEAPADMAGKVPGRVVATLPNGTPVYGGQHMVSKALAQVFDGADHGLTVAAFCR